VSILDWSVLVGSLVFIVVYGVWKGRENANLDDYILAGRTLKWYTIALSIMATQASAITFISTPGQAYVDGMRFVQFYLGLPVGMVILSITAVPIYHRLKVYTAYEYLEGRFDLKTRTLTALLFLTQRGLAAGLTIFAPALILSIMMGWNLYLTNLVIGTLVVIYTAYGGTKAVNHTNFLQLLIAMTGMVVAFVCILLALPNDISMMDGVRVAGKMGKLNAIDFSFDPNNRYNFWSGLIGGLFLQLSYFGTDQSQVQRYLTGRSIAQSRIALLFNGMVKIPMQFFILFVGAMVFVYYLFVTPPVFFNQVELDKVRGSDRAVELVQLEQEHAAATGARSRDVEGLIAALDSGNETAIEAATKAVDASSAAVASVRERTVTLMQEVDEDADSNDTNYIFLTFVMAALPTGLIGLVIAAVFAASMSSTASELNALASTTVVDIYRRLAVKNGSDRHYVNASKLFTLVWGVFAISFAMYANRLGSLIEAVNILGSLFYGTILGVFLVGFYLKRVRGHAVFVAALLAQAVVVWCRLGTEIAYLWYNVIGCVAVAIFALALEPIVRRVMYRRPGGTA